MKSFLPPDLSTLSRQELQELVQELVNNQQKLESQSQESGKIRIESGESLYLDLYQSAPVGYLTLNFDGEIIEANRRACHILGSDLEQLTGKPLDSMISDVDRVLFSSHLTKILQTKADASCQMRLKRPNGTMFVAELQSNALKGQNGKSYGFRIILLDITERFQSQMSELKLRENLESLWELSKIRDQDLKFLTDHLLEEIKRISESRYAFYGFINREETEMEIYSWSTEAMKQCKIDDKPLVFPISQAGIWGDAIRERKALIINDYSVDHTGKKGLPPGHVALTRLVSIPIFSKGRIVAVGAVANKESDYTEDDVRQLEAFLCNAQIMADQKRAEDLVSRNEINLQSFFQTISESVFLMKPDGEILAANQTFASRLGRPLEDLLGRCVYEYVDPGCSERRKNWVDEVVRSGKSLTIEDQRQDAIMVHSIRPVLNSEGEVDRLAVYAQDVTASRRAELALKESEARFRLFVEAANEGVWSMDKEFKTTFVNRRMAEMIGYSADEMLGQRVDSFMFEEDLPNHLERMAARQAGINGSYERRFKRKDGEEIWILVSATSLIDDNLGFQGSFAMFTDITERKRSENALKNSEELYRNLFRESKRQQEIYEALLNCSPDPIIIYDMEGRVQYLNPAHSKLFGWTLEEAKGKLLNTVPEWDRGATLEIIRKIVYGGEMNQSYDTQRLTKEGRVVDVSVSGARYLDDQGNPVGMLVIIHDMTQRKLAEREREALRTQFLQAQKMEAVGTLAGGIAHDFNNLLQIVLGYSQIILDSKKDVDSELDNIKQIYLAGERGAELVKSLMTFSRKAESRPEIINLNDQVERLTKMLGRTIPKMIDIECILDPDLGHIHADPTQIDQVLVNLAVNARDAMSDEGKITIQTKNVLLGDDYRKMHGEFEPGRYALLAMTDTGHGMDSKTLERIFEPFFTTKEKGKGTGLGLATVYGIISQHKGLVECESEPGHGTTFKIYLPAISGKNQFPEKTTEECVSNGGTERILVVDDEEALTIVLERILGRAGYTVLTASDGEQALDLYKREAGKISLVIMDVVMPKMGGWKCLEEILKVDSTAKVLIATGVPGKGEFAQLTKETGARGFINKPYEVKKLLRIVREILNTD